MDTLVCECRDAPGPADRSAVAPALPDRVLAALLETSRDYFALPAQPIYRTRASAAAARCC